MPLATDIAAQVRRATIRLVEESLAVDQNFPSESDGEIKWAGYKNLSFSLMGEDYPTLYKLCLGARDYNFLLIDGAFVQMKYRFSNGSIHSHVLGFYPTPNLLSYGDLDQDFEETFYGNTMFSEVRDKHVVAFPIRFDFSDVHAELVHPRCHMTLGSYATCRIPVARPISPNIFLHFILRNFYFEKFNECLSADFFSCAIQFDDTITNGERDLLHINFGDSSVV